MDWTRWNQASKIIDIQCVRPDHMKCDPRYITLKVTCDAAGISTTIIKPHATLNHLCMTLFTSKEKKRQLNFKKLKEMFK